MKIKRIILCLATILTCTTVCSCSLLENKTPASSNTSFSNENSASAKTSSSTPVVSSSTESLNKRFIFRADADANDISLNLFDDGSFLLEEYVYSDPFIVKIEGSYKIQNNVIRLNVEQNGIDNRFKGYDIKEIEFNIINEEKVELQTDLSQTKKSSIFWDESLFAKREDYAIFGKSSDILYYYSTDLKDGRQNSLMLLENGKYSLNASIEESPDYADIFGNYVKEEDKIILAIEYNGLVHKYPEYNVNEIVFSILDIDSIKLETDLALTRAGTLFFDTKYGK